MNKTAFLSVVFPQAKAFLSDFFQSLQTQTFKDFDVIVVNDGIKDFDKYKKKFNDLNIIEIKTNNSPAKNREIGINNVIDLKYDFLVFGDSDDCFSENRVEQSINYLENYDIVVNDIAIVDNNKKMIFDNYLSQRIDNNQCINIDFIYDKNIFGLSNTAVRTAALKNINNLDESLIAVDWYIFTVLLLNNKKAIFTNKTKTFYRQHNTNTIGMDSLDINKVKTGILVKKLHYNLLKQNDNTFNNLFLQASELYKKTENKIFLNHYFENLKKHNINCPLWWENIYINEDYYGN